MTKPQEHAHSEMSPSNGARWMNCPGSVALCRTMPRKPGSKAAAEGTAAHSVLEKALNDSNYGVWDHVGEKELGFEITEEMAEAVSFARDYVLAELQRGGKLLVEHRVTIVEGLIYGTLDVGIVREYESLTIIDFKYGKGVVVSAVDNTQMMLYLVGEDREHDVIERELVIIQPRTEDQVSRWTVTEEYFEDFKRELPRKIAMAQEENAFTSAGSWCRWCDAKAVCPSLRTEIKETLPAVKGADFLLPDVKTLTGEVVKRVLDYSEVITKWLKAVAAYGQDMLEAGGELPGYELYKKRCNRRWIDEEAVLKEFADLGEEAFKVKVLSPNQIEKIVGKEGKDRTAKLTEKPEGDMSLRKTKEKKDNGK